MPLIPSSSPDLIIRKALRSRHLSGAKHSRLLGVSVWMLGAWELLVVYHGPAPGRRVSVREVWSVCCTLVAAVPLHLVEPKFNGGKLLADKLFAKIDWIYWFSFTFHLEFNLLVRPTQFVQTTVSKNVPNMNPQRGFLEFQRKNFHFKLAEHFD